MKFYAGLLIAFTLLTYSATQAQTQSASHRKAAEELITQMNLEKTLDQSIDVMLQTLIQQNPVLEEFKDTMTEFLKKYMSWERMAPKYIDLYANTFTEKELKEIAQFYQTETGRKLTAITPELLRKGSELGQQAVQDHIPELQKMLEERAAALGKGSE